MSVKVKANRNDRDSERKVGKKEIPLVLAGLTTSEPSDNDLNSLFDEDEESPDASYSGSQAERLLDARHEDIHNAQQGETSLFEVRLRQRLDRERRQGRRELARAVDSDLREAAESETWIASSVGESSAVPCEATRAADSDLPSTAQHIPSPVTPPRRTQQLPHPMSAPHQTRNAMPLNDVEQRWLDRKREGEFLHITGLFQFLHVAKKREAILVSAKRELEEEMEGILVGVDMMEGRRTKRKFKHEVKEEALPVYL